MVDFSKYKEQRKQKTEELTKSMSRQSNRDDARFWKPTLDSETGIGGAIIRFLPVADDETLDYVDYTSYSIKWEKTDSWFIMKSRYKLRDIDPTQDPSDPVYELRQRLYNTKQDIDKKIAETLRSNKNYVANILVIKDPAKPENNGKVFLYRYGATIHKMVEASLKPTADPLTGIKPNEVDPFDLYDGANLEIRLKQTKQGWEYDGTKFQSPSAIIEETEQAFNELMSKVYPLKEFIDVKSFPSYDEMQKRLVRVIGEQFIGSGVEVITRKDDSQSNTQPTTPAPKDGGSMYSQKDETSSKMQNTLQEDSDDVPDTPPWNDETSTSGNSTESDDDFFANIMADINK